ncbi:MAG: RdgB/HAM1 family non-canonical purine NTP pyrophosphatase [Porticoccaceae bacterium]|nr:RdgB/HAM1 family non-canonical purine NTP pyrophosphatase [Porticoccaceae bacterium]
MTEKLVLASGNSGKLKEFQALLASADFEVLPQAEFFATEAEESGLSFVENAIIKARYAANHSGLPALADDSGLEVDCLRGAPGIYSGRFAGENASDEDNNRKLLDQLQDIPEQQRSARFQCVLVYMRHAQDPGPLICQGTWEGMILSEPRGINGFGYDPLFFAPDQNCTSAQLSADTKNMVSHRGRAMKKLLAAFARGVVNKNTEGSAVRHA